MIAIIIDDLVADGARFIESAILIWIFSMSSVLYYHSGLVSKYWRTFGEDELHQKIEGLHEMHAPGILAASSICTCYSDWYRCVRLALDFVGVQLALLFFQRKFRKVSFENAAP